jgi:transcriptional regulator with XRE-family HTH domain
MKVHLYRTYLFKNKDPIVDKMRTIIQDEQVSYKELEARSGVTASTLYGWFHGATKRPQHATAMAVIRALGYDMRLVQVGKATIGHDSRRAQKPAESRPGAAS